MSKNCEKYRCANCYDAPGGPDRGAMLIAIVVFSLSGLVVGAVLGAVITVLLTG